MRPPATEAASTLVTGKRRDSNVYFVPSAGNLVLDTAWRGRAESIRNAAETPVAATLTV